MDPVIRRARYILRQSAALLAAAEENDGVPFQHALSPPEEFREPDLSRTKRLDREQEAQGLRPTPPRRGCQFGWDTGARLVCVSLCLAYGARVTDYLAGNDSDWPLPSRK
jgi:hypothetical protein